MDQTFAALQALRRDLHRNPDLSGDEGGTVARLLPVLAATQPSRIVQGLGGHGLAVVYDSGRAGPTILLRAELDALPIREQGDIPHRSLRDGVAHLCGHDGHMAVLVGVAQQLQMTPPPVGRVILLFQPAEETGAGARAVLADPRFADLRPDWAFALHNMPGLPLGELAVAAGPASCASVGIKLHFHGVEAHAAFPETGRCPTPALAALLDMLAPLTQVPPMGPAFQLATLCHITMGTPAFGIAPAQAEAWITLRALSDDGLATLERQVTGQAAELAARFGLTLTTTRHDHFNATINDAQAAEMVAQAANAARTPRTAFNFPMRPSEDFGAFIAQTRTALFFMGSGGDCAPLHNPAYDFPDILIPPACAVFQAILQQVWADARD
jgi:amidohydrolase